MAIEALPTAPALPPSLIAISTPADPAHRSVASRSISRVPVALSALRVRQWTKNALVMVPLFTSGRLLELHASTSTALAVLAFCLAASTVYLGNDIVDRELDAAHPRKRHRPIASGRLGLRGAWSLRTFTFAAAVGVGLLAGIYVAAVCLGYMVVMEAYTHRLKHVPVIELAIVAGGFVARVLTGSAASGIPASRWLIIVVSAAALHLVATKRAVELERTADGAPRRAVLAAYSANYLREIRLISLGVAVIGYCLWAFERASLTGNGPWPQLSIVPVVLAVMHYGWLADTRHTAEAPDEVLLHDRTVQLCAVAWAALFAVAVLTAHR